MARRKKTEETDTIMENYSEPCFDLAPGFYFLDENRNLRTKQVTRGKPGEERRVETEPISVNTIQKAKDSVTLAGVPLAILCVTETMQWPV